MKLSNKEQHALTEMANPIGQRNYSLIHGSTIHALERKGLLGHEGSYSHQVTALGRAALKEAALPKVAKNQTIKNIRRLSEAAERKLETILRFGAATLRDKILDEALNRLEDFESSGALNASREIALNLGATYRRAALTNFNIKNWYQACGLSTSGELPLVKKGTSR